MNRALDPLDISPESVHIAKSLDPTADCLFDNGLFFWNSFSAGYTDIFEGFDNDALTSRPRIQGAMSFLTRTLVFRRDIFEYIVTHRKIHYACEFSIDWNGTPRSLKWYVQNTYGHVNNPLLLVRNSYNKEIDPL